MSIAEIYAKNFNKQTKYYFAQWLPNSPLSLGVVGILEDGYFFRPKTTLADLGIPFDPVNDIEPDDSPTPLNLFSNKGVTMSVKLEGEVNPKIPSIPQGKAGLSLEFELEGGFVIKAPETFEPRIRDITRFEREILKAYLEKRWNRNYSVIFSLVSAPYADIVVSQASNSKLELQAEGKGEVGNVELGNVKLQLMVKSQSGSVLNMLGSKDVYPAFQLMGLKRRLFKSPSVGLLKMLTPKALAYLALEEKPEDLYLDLIEGSQE